MTPGVEERKLRSRLVFRLTGRWPRRVVEERLANLREHEFAVVAARAERKRCPACGEGMTAEGSSTGPYIFCPHCGCGGRD